MNNKDNGFIMTKDSGNLFRKRAFMGAGMCAACCLLPIAGLIFGMSTLTFLADVLEWAGGITIVTAATFLAISYYRRPKGAACDVKCSCRK